MKIISIEKTAIQKFMQTWPCSGLHHIHHITACFADDGDLVDFEAYADEKETIPVNHYGYDCSIGSGAMPVLLQEAFENCKELPRVLSSIQSSFVYE